MTGLAPTTTPLAAQPVTTAPARQPQPAAPTTAPAAPGAQVNVAAGNSAAIIENLFQQPLAVGAGVFGNNQRTLSSAITEMSKLSDQRQRRLKDIYLAIAADAQATGQYNQYALQRAQRETTLEEQSSSLMRSVFDKLNNATQAWVQR